MRQYRRRLTTVGAAMAIFWLLGSGLCLGNSFTVTPTVVGPSAAVFTYSYELTDVADSRNNIFSFELSGLGPILPGSVLAPTGWTASQSPGTVAWISDDPAFDISAGTSLNGFGFESPSGPGVVSYLLLGSEPGTGVPTTTESGSTVGPTAIPEPATGLLALTACLALFTFVRRLSA